MRRLRSAVVLAVALAGGGCASQPPTAVPDVAAPVPTARPVEATQLPTPSAEPTPESLSTQTCDGPGAVTAQFGIVDAALGNRYLVVTVSNCSQEPVELPAEPALDWISADGTVFDSTWDFREPHGSLVLEPAGAKYLVLHWLSNGTCDRGPGKLRLELLGEQYTARDCFQFGGSYAPEREGAAADARWSDTPS